MRLGRRKLLGAAASTLVVAPAAGAARLRIGVLTDMAGPFAAISGAGSLACTRQAVAEAGAAGASPVEVLVADHRNDAREGARIAGEWFAREGVSLVLDVPNSAVALAVAEVARAANRAYVNCSSGTTKLTGEACAATTVHWSFDTFMLARSTGGAVVAQGGSTWFVIAADYEFGRQIEADLSRLVLAAGGRMQGIAYYPFPKTNDFAPFLEQARMSGAQVLGFANAGADAVAAVAQATRAGLAGPMRLAAMLLEIGDIHGLGLETAAGLYLTETFYWDLNEATRRFTRRLMAAQNLAVVPGMGQAGCYSAARHFLRAVAGGADPADGAAVVRAMKGRPVEDEAFGSGEIRADGRALFPAYLFQVKAPGESAEAFDYYRPVSVTPAEAAARPAGEGGCRLEAAARARP